MIRIRIAAALLRSTGATVEYRVKRIKDRSHSHDIAEGKITHIASRKPSNTDGATLFRTAKLRDAVMRYLGVRVADRDTIALQLVASVKQRHGDVESS